MQRAGELLGNGLTDMLGWHLEDDCDVPLQHEIERRQCVSLAKKDVSLRHAQFFGHHRQHNQLSVVQPGMTSAFTRYTTITYTLYSRLRKLPANPSPQAIRSGVIELWMRTESPIRNARSRLRAGLLPEREMRS